MSFWRASSVVLTIPVAASAYSTEMPAPEYPMEAFRECAEGKVLVEITADASGRAKKVVVLESEPPELFDKTAIKLAYATSWSQPDLRDDQGSMTFKNTFRFEIEGECIVDES